MIKIIHDKYTCSTLYRENQSNVHPRFIYAPSAVVDMRRILMTRHIKCLKLSLFKYNGVWENSRWGKTMYMFK